MLKLGKLEMARSRPKLVEKDSVSYLEYLDICAKDSPRFEQGVELAKLLDLGNTLLRRLEQICSKTERCSTLLELLKSDSPKSANIFVGEQSEKSKKAGNAPPTALIFEFLDASYGEGLELVLLEEDMNFNQRAATLTDVKQSGGYLLVATDIAARGVDLPETTHIYNFDLPKDAVNYLHRVGRTGRKPFSDSKCKVWSQRSLDKMKETLTEKLISIPKQLDYNAL